MMKKLIEQVPQIVEINIATSELWENTFIQKKKFIGKQEQLIS